MLVEKERSLPFALTATRPAPVAGRLAMKFSAAPTAPVWCPRFLTLGLVAATAAVAASPSALADLSAGEASTVALLDALQDGEEMPDVMLWVLDRAATDPQASAELKRQIPFRRAAALVGTTSTESDGKKRAAILDEAEREIDNFLATLPEGQEAIDAYSQKGNLLIQRGRGKVEQAKQAGADVAALRADAVRFFDAAIKSLQGTVKPGQPIEKVTNAEDAVIKLLRSTDAELASMLKPDDGKPGDPKKAPKPKPKPSKRPTAEAKRQEELEERQLALQTKLIQTRILVAETYFEKSKAFDPQSKEWQTILEESTNRHREIADKYANKGAGYFARYYQGRNLVLLGKRDQALAALAGVYGVDFKQPLLQSLRAKALAAALECWLAEKKYDQLDDTALKFLITPARNPKQLDADWLAAKYRCALLLDARAESLPANERAKKGVLQKEARKLAMEVVTAGREFTKDARELSAKLGKDLPPEEQEESTFTTAVADARLKYDAMKGRQLTAKEAKAVGKEAEATAAFAEAAAARDEAILAYTAALKLADDGKQDVNAVTSARSMLAYLLYDAKRYREAAELGGLLAEKFPDAMGSRQASKVALASWQALMKDADAGKEAKQKLFALAEFMAAKWPTDEEGAIGLATLVAAALETRNVEQILTAMKKVPAESPKRAELQQRVGTALWREVREKRQLEEQLRPDAKTLDTWKAEAKAMLDAGLAVDVASPLAVGAALTRVQIAIEDGDMKLAGELLSHPKLGPWTVVQSGDPILAQGPLAEGSLTVALRYFIQNEQVDNAQKAMDLLEKTAGDPATLTSLYLSMGRDLESQLQALAAQAADPGVRERAGKVLSGFESFLDRVAARDERIASQMWVATTFMALGSGKGLGAIVPKDKAQAYLDRAAGVFASLLKKGGDEIATYEPSIRLRMAGIFRERGKWDDAQEQIDWYLADPKRQNSLDAQVQAAELLQTAGRDAATSDPEKANKQLLLATVGRKGDGAVLWGWGAIANKLSKQVGGGGKMDEIFYESRMNIARCMLERAQLPVSNAEKKAELLTSAKKAIAVTRKLYPALGGESTEKRFEKLLKEIQKAQGLPQRGFEELDEQGAAAKPVAAAAAGT